MDEVEETMVDLTCDDDGVPKIFDGVKPKPEANENLPEKFEKLPTGVTVITIEPLPS